MDCPIVIWPPDAWYGACWGLGSYFDCTYDYPYYAAMGAIVCCPAW